jgi:DNA-sulfur modification-associated
MGTGSKTWLHSIHALLRHLVAQPKLNQRLEQQLRADCLRLSSVVGGQRPNDCSISVIDSIWRGSSSGPKALPMMATVDSAHYTRGSEAKMATTKKAEAPYIETKQGSRRFILTKLPASVVTVISYAATRGQSAEEGAVQRVLNPGRINSVKAFTLQGGDYPNAIVLNWVSDVNKLTTDGSKVSFAVEPQSAQIIDGQHRIAGIKAAIEDVKSFGKLELPVVIYRNPPRVRIVVAPIEQQPPGAAMKDDSGSIRTSIQGQSGSDVASAGERDVGTGCAGSWRWGGNTGAVARGCAVQAPPRAALDCGRPI